MPETSSATSVFIYVARRDEVQTRRIIDTLSLAGCRLLIPNLVDKITMECVCFPGWDAMIPGPLGILNAATATGYDGPVDLAVIPGLGFSETGARLGFGAGYYDRWLAKHPETEKIALCYEGQLVPDLPCEPHDISMDVIVTDRRLLRFRLKNNQ
jgi:5-formyltetrahydrofolate cyclo-ligase